MKKTLIDYFLTATYFVTDDDPLVIEKQEEQHPVSLPLSYVLRFFTDAARKEFPDVKPKIKSVVQNASNQSQRAAQNAANKPLASNVAQNKNFSPAGIAVILTLKHKKTSFLPLLGLFWLMFIILVVGSDNEEDEVLTDSDSNDSWTTSEEFSSEYILRYGSRYGLQNSTSSWSC